MPVEYKSVKAATLGVDGMTVTGIFAVHGNVDAGDGWSYRDRSHPGLFGDFKAAGRDRAVFLWNHMSHEPPIATIDQLIEVAGADLPPAVRLYAPDATGGVAVKRTYLSDDPATRAGAVFAAVKAGALREMSYAYEVTRFDIEKPPDGSRDLPIRNLYSAELFDVSDVNWGMNPATSADGSKGRPLAAHGDQVRADVAAYTAAVVELVERRAKEGRTFSSANVAALNEVADQLSTSAAKLRELLKAAEPKTATHATDVRRLLLDAQRTLAMLNGVPLR